MTGWLGRLGGGRTQDGGAGILINTAREIVGRRRSLQGGLNEVRHPSVLDALSEADFAFLDVTVAERVNSDREFATVLARLTHHAARSKGFDRQTVDCALRLEPLLPADDPNREREKLLRDAYAAAQRSGYIRGGRQTLARLAQRFLESGDTERARTLFKQEIEISGEEHDTATEVEVAIQLGDLCRRDADSSTAVELYKRAARSAERLDYSRGLAEALQRQTEMMPPGTSLDARSALQRQALDAAQRTLDRVLESKIAAGLADSLSRGGKPEDAIDQLASGLRIARDIGDLNLEARCLTALAKADRRLGNWAGAVEYERDLVTLEERLGNRPAVAEASVNLGSSLLSLGRAQEALDAFDRAHGLALALSDLDLEQRAQGGIGVTQSVLGHPTEANDHLTRAVHLAQRSNDLRGEAKWLASIAQMKWSTGDEEAAIETALDTIELARRVENLDLQAGMFALLGRIYGASKQATRARESYGRALHLYRRLKYQAEIVTILGALGNLALDSGVPDQAETLYAEAVEVAATLDDHGQIAKLHGRLGRLVTQRGDVAGGIDHLRRAVEHGDRSGRPAIYAKALQHYASALHSAQDPATIETYRFTIGQLQAIDDVPGEALMRLNLGTLLTSDGAIDEGLIELHGADSLAERLGTDGAGLRRHIAAAIGSAEAQRRPVAPPPRDPRERPPTRGGRFALRRQDERRSRSAGRPEPQTAPAYGDERYGAYDDQAQEYVPDYLLAEGEDRLYRESTLPPE